MIAYKPKGLYVNLFCIFKRINFCMEKRERTRNHIIWTSASVFNTYGYAGTSISDVLEVSGYSKGALYNAFKDKEDLFKAVFKYNISILQKAFREQVKNTESARARLLAIPLFYQKNIVDSLLPGGCPILNTAIEADDTNPDLNNLVKGAFDDWKNIVHEIIDKGKESGEFSKNIDAEGIAFFMIATIEGSIALAKSYKDWSIVSKNMMTLKEFMVKRI